MSVPNKFDGSDASAETFPQNFGRYVLNERIGSGGMAEIFRAVTVGTEGFRRVLVVKRIRKSLDASSEFLRMFFDEAKISALLNHPYIVQIYDFGQIDGAYFLAMEHVDGRDLGNVLRRLHKLGKQLHPSTAALIAQQVAQGLHYAHTLQSADGQPFNIVHRDVNPVERDAAADGDREDPRLRDRQGLGGGGESPDARHRDQRKAQLSLARAGALRDSRRALRRLFAGARRCGRC